MDVDQDALKGFMDAYHCEDLTPYVEEAISRCPFKHDFTFDEVLALLSKRIRGKYIPVDVQDRIEGRRLDSLLLFVMFRVRNTHRVSQIRDPDVQRMRPYIEFKYFADTPPCAQAMELSGRWLHPDELKPFPLDGCFKQLCFCDYRTNSKRDLERSPRDWPLPNSE